MLVFCRASALIWAGLFVTFTPAFAQGVPDTLIYLNQMDQSNCAANGGDWSGMTCNNVPFNYNPENGRAFFKAIKDYWAKEYKETMCVVPLAVGRNSKEIVKMAKDAMKRRNLKELNIYDNYNIKSPWRYTASQYFEKGFFPAIRSRVCFTNTNQEKLGFVGVIAFEEKDAADSTGYTIIAEDFFLKRLLD